MVIVDSTKLEITGEVPTPANTDLIAFNPQTGLVYECNDTAGEVWVIDPAAKKIVDHHQGGWQRRGGFGV